MDKTCSKCLLPKPLTDFDYHPKAKHKKSHLCKGCKAEYDTHYRAGTKDSRARYQKSYQKVLKAKSDRTKKAINQDWVRRELNYSRSTGEFHWIDSGLRADLKMSHGYMRINFHHCRLLAHRLAVLYVKGYLPECLVDHRDGIRHHNWWSNLREATQSCNMQNVAIRSDNKSGIAGVVHTQIGGPSSARWQAKGTHAKKQVHLGSYHTKLEAALARLTWEEWCISWTCNERSELYSAIVDMWPEFQNTKGGLMQKIKNGNAKCMTLKGRNIVEDKRKFYIFKTIEGQLIETKSVSEEEAQAYIEDQLKIKLQRAA